MDFVDFLYRIKQELDLKQDKDVADFLGISIKAFSARKSRNSIPVNHLKMAAFKQPELKIDVDYILTGERNVDKSTKKSIEKADIDAQYVMYGEHKQTAFRQPENHLTEQEREWLMLLKQLTPTARKSVLDFAKYQLADQGKKETAEDHQIQRYYGT